MNAAVLLPPLPCAVYTACNAHSRNHLISSRWVVACTAIAIANIADVVMRLTPDMSEATRSSFLVAGILIMFAMPVLLNMLDISLQAGGGGPDAHLGRPEDDGAVMIPSRAVHCWQPEQAGAGCRNKTFSTFRKQLHVVTSQLSQKYMHGAAAKWVVIQQCTLMFTHARQPAASSDAVFC